MQEARRNKIHDQRLPILQPGVGDERGRSREHRAGERQRKQDRLAGDEPQLGAKLAIQCCLGGPAPLIPGSGQRQTELHFMEHCPRQLAVRSNLRWQEFPRLIFSLQPPQKKTSFLFSLPPLFLDLCFVVCFDFFVLKVSPDGIFRYFLGKISRAGREYKK